MQVAAPDMVIGADDATLEQAEIAFRRIHMR